MREYSFYTKNFKIHTSEKEIKDLLLSWILISIAFAILKTENIITDIISKKFVILIIISGITVGIAFIIHELAHKIVAQKYNCWAEFRADITMLIIALLMSFTGFLFIAPGAVIISGNVTKKQNGIISIAGPLTNIALAIILLPLLFIETTTILKEIIQSGYIINSWIALFNMIPIWNFDGHKILKWNKVAYTFTILIAATLLFISFIIN